jgi:hypothetical protein
MNTILPNSKLTGVLKLQEVFDFYDGPKLFTCSNAVGQRFLGYWIGSDDVGDSYWLISISKERSLMIRSGGISLLTAITDPELGYLFRCVVHFADEITDIEVILPAQVERDLLPDSDEFIKLPTETLPERLTELDLPRKAISVRREIVSLHFNFPGTREEAPTKQLGKSLVSFQEVLDALGQNLSGNPTMRGAIAPEILANTETRLIQAAGGSFAIEISAAREVNLFDESLITDTLAEFVELLGIGNDVERLRDKLIAIKPRAASKYRVFLTSILASQSPLTLEWASPDPNRNRTVNLDLPTAAGALMTAEQVTSEIGETRTGIGYFVGVELPRKSFTAVLLGDEDPYRGKIADTAMPEAIHITLNQNYQITIRETLEVSASGEEKPKYELEKIAPVQ